MGGTLEKETWAEWYWRGQRKNINRSDHLQVLRMVQHVDDAGVAAIVCTVRGNTYHYFENQLHFEHSWEAHQVTVFPAIWRKRRLIIVLILFIFLALKIPFLQFFIVLLQNVRCRTSCGWSYPSLGLPYRKEFWLLVCKQCNYKIFVQDNTNRHT